MGLIEQAAKRLEELRRAGVEIAPAALPADPGPAHERAAPPAPAPAPAPAHEPPHVAEVPRRAPERPTGPVHRIDLGRLAAAGFVTPDEPRSPIADEFRIVKRPLISNASAGPENMVKDGHLVMVTSAMPGEGKTFTSVNLAMSIAMELDRTVLLVDGDVVRPTLPRALGIDPGPGLLDILGSTRTTLADVLVHTNVPRLSILRAGTPHPGAAELLASNAMGRFLGELGGKRERIVIFDSPPLLATTEARQLAARMGQIVFVVHAETTLQSDVKQALATIEACPVKLLVLNGARTTGQGAYGYGYGYGYGAGQGG